MKNVRITSLWSIVAIVIGIENYLFFFGREAAQLGFVTSAIRVPISAFLDFMGFSNEFDDAIYAGIIGILALAIEVFLDAQYSESANYEKKYVKGKAVNAMRVLSGFAYILCALPLILIGWYAVRWIVYFVCTWFVKMGGDYSWCDRVFDFLGRKECKAVAVALIDIALLKKFVFYRIIESPFKKGGYRLPKSYKAAVVYLLGPDAASYRTSFDNEDHYLLYLSEAVDLGFQKCNVNFKPEEYKIQEYEINGAAFDPTFGLYWTEKTAYTSSGFCRNFAVDTKVGDGVKWSDFSELCINAARGWKKRNDWQKALHYYQMLSDIAYSMSMSWPYRGPRDYLIYARESFGAVISLYRYGNEQVEASSEKVAEYIRKRKVFEEMISKAEAAGKKRILREEKSTEYLRTSSAPASAASSSAKSPAADIQRDFAFPRFIYDADEYPWELMNSGYDNATYYCQKTGETKMFHKSDFNIGSPSGFHQR